VGSVPVGDVVNVALGCCGGDEVAPADGHIDHAVFEVKVFLEVYILREDVSDLNAILIIEVCFPVIVGDLLVYYLTENHVAVPTSTSAQCSVSRPSQLLH
jgi:hypothetical protein